MDEPAGDAPVKKEKKKRLKGFAGMIGSMLKAANDSERFKERFAGKQVTIAVVATDFPPAALVAIHDGTVAVEELALDQVKGTKKDALIQGKMDDIMAVASGKVNPVKAWVTRKVKLRGVSKLPDLARAFYYAIKQQKLASQPAPAPGPA